MEPSLFDAPRRLLERHRASILDNLTGLLANRRLCPECHRLLAWPAACPQHPECPPRPTRG